MKKAARILLSLACLSLLAGGALAQEPDAEGCKDPALFNRMPGYRIQRCEEKDFDAHSFRDAKGQDVSVEGHVYEIRYSIQRAPRRRAGCSSSATTRTPSPRSAGRCCRATTRATRT